MKKIMLVLTVLFFVLQSFSQQRLRPARDKDYYAAKSAHMRTTSLVLAGVGAVAVTAGILIINNNRDNGNFESYINSTWAGFLLTVAGTAAVITSIPLFIVSEHLKRKGLGLSFNNRGVWMPVQNGFVSKAQPSLTLSLRF